MKRILGGKVATVIILLATFVLAGVAIFTAIRLYQLRQTPVAPNVPSSLPRAAENTCSLSFTLAVTTPTPTPTGTPTTTPTPTPVPECNTTCTQDSGCPSSLVCYIVSGATTGNCRNTSCRGESNCTCATPTPTPTPTPTGTPNTCNGTCGSNSNCNNDLICSGGFCRNPSCTSETDCTCPGSTPTPTPTPTPTAPALPQSGTDWPSMLGIMVGVITIIGSLILAL